MGLVFRFVSATVEFFRFSREDDSGHFLTEDGNTFVQE
jgi:hypothetical protein